MRHENVLYIYVCVCACVCVLPLNYTTLDYNSIELLCFHHNFSAGVSFILQHCITRQYYSFHNRFGRFLGRSFDRTIGPLDYWTFGLLDFRAYTLFVLKDLRRDVFFCFVDIADHHCFNLLFIKQNYTIQHTLNQVLGNVILLWSVNLNSAYHCGTFFTFLKGIGPRD